MILYTKFCSHHYWRVWIRTHTGPNYGEVSWIRIRIIEQHFQLLDTYEYIGITCCVVTLYNISGLSVSQRGTADLSSRVVRMAIDKKTD